MHHPVDIWCYRVDKIDFSALFNIKFLVLLNMQTCQLYLFLDVFILILGFLDALIICHLPFLKRQQQRLQGETTVIHPVKQDQQDNKQNDGNDNNDNHYIQLPGRKIQLLSTRLQLSVLSGLFLEIQIQIAINVTIHLIINRRIDKT